MSCTHTCFEEDALEGLLVARESGGHMKLYFSPMSCSAASRIALYEAGAEAELVEVSPRSKTLLVDGSDYRAVNPLGYVPFLEHGALRIAENGAILQYIAARYPDAKLAPTDDAGRASLQRWLSFVATELHKALFAPLLDPKAPPAVKEYVLVKGTQRMAWLEEQLAGREWLLDAFSVADAYLVTVLAWTAVVPVTLGPETRRYLEAVRRRPSVARAVREEYALFLAAQARGAA